MIAHFADFLAFIAGIFMGAEVVFPVTFYDGFIPPIDPTEVQLQSNVAVGGNYLGSSIIMQGTVLNVKFDYMTATFVRSTLTGFVPSFNAGAPLWFGWRPFTFPSELTYCWREGGAAKPVNAGGLNLMSLSLQMRAYEG